MTLHQLMTLADQHRAAHRSGTAPEQQTSGPGLMDLAAMTRR
ncbi:hypothetical protein CG747_20815 [Streptomyces sp. CB02959]|nr:hypothetical protein [Streptomyces sp. CB02959]PJN38985.1 hypothetical protein CG747_20815 [Streptomyces sp. CB02959]